MPPAGSVPEAGLRRGQPAAVGRPGEITRTGSRAAGAPGRPGATRGRWRGRQGIARTRRAGRRSASRPVTRPGAVVRGVGREPPGLGLARRSSARCRVVPLLTRRGERDLGAVGREAATAGAPRRREGNDVGAGSSAGRTRHSVTAAAVARTRHRPRPAQSIVAGIGASQWPRRPAPRPASRTPPSAPAARPSRPPCAGSAGPGSLRRQCRMIRSSSLGTSGTSSLGGLGCSLQERGERLGARAAAERPPARDHLVEHGAEAEDVAARVDRPAAAPARATCSAGVPATVPGRLSRAWASSVVSSSPSVPSAWSSLARPKSRTLTTPSGVTMTFAGLRSRWTMPAAWAAASASASGIAMRSASPRRIARAARDGAERLPGRRAP